MPLYDLHVTWGNVRIGYYCWGIMTLGYTNHNKKHPCTQRIRSKLQDKMKRGRQTVNERKGGVFETLKRPVRERKRGGHFTLYLFRLVTAYQKFALLWEHLPLRPFMCHWQGETHYTVSKRVNVCVFVSERTRCPEGLCQFHIPKGIRLQVILERKTLSNQMETLTPEPPRRRWNCERRWPCSEESLLSLGRSSEREYSSLRREFWRTRAVWECHWWCGLPVGFSLFSVSVTHNT